MAKDHGGIVHPDDDRRVFHRPGVPAASESEREAPDAGPDTSDWKWEPML